MPFRQAMQGFQTGFSLGAMRDQLRTQAQQRRANAHSFAIASAAMSSTARSTGVAAKASSKSGRGMRTCRVTSRPMHRWPAGARVRSVRSRAAPAGS